MKFLILSLILLWTTVNSDICPDKKTQCDQGQTCCPSSSGYACCPLENAVCCEDLQHCCPDEYICIAQFNVCVKCPDVSRNHNIKQELLTKSNRKDSNVCPGSQEQCPSGQTCCPMAGGQVGCCPLPNAACCPDQLHCCPNGYSCDPDSGECIANNLSLPWFIPKSNKNIKNRIEKHVNKNVKQVTCPDGGQCADGQTCCMMTSGQYGCCPYPQAVCCSDKLHCCPSGYTCDVSAGLCELGKFRLPWSTSQLANKNVKQVTCPDGGQCADGQTCCMMTSGQYGCCPYPQAVCCSDQLHCCPNGTTCDVQSSQCLRGPDVIPWFEKKPAVKRITL